jgi:hypothetical protein
VLSNSPGLLDESILGASGTWVVIAAGDGATDFLPAFLPAVLFFAGAFLMVLEVDLAFFEAVFLAAFFPLFFATAERDFKVAADLFFEPLVFAVFLAFFAPFLLPFLATI